jgi:hypothetical protein
MLAKDIEVGKTYVIRHHDGRFYAVKVLSTRTHISRGSYSGHGKFMTHYMCEKLVTGRTIEVKSAAKFRKEVVTPAPPMQGIPNPTPQEQP